MEIWKDVIGYEGIYEVSNHGRIRTHKDKITFSNRHGIRKWKQRILKEKNPNGRDVRVSLWKEGKTEVEGYKIFIALRPNEYERFIS